MSGLVELVVHGTSQTTGVSVGMISHVDTRLGGGLLFESSDLVGGIIDGEVVKELLGSSLMLVGNSLGSSVDLLLSLPLTTIKAEVNGDLTLIEDAGVSEELLVTELGDTVLELEVLVDLHSGGDLSPKMLVIIVKKSSYEEEKALHST